MTFQFSYEWKIFFCATKNNKNRKKLKTEEMKSVDSRRATLSFSSYC